MGLMRLVGPVGLFGQVDLVGLVGLNKAALLFDHQYAL